MVWVEKNIILYLQANEILKCISPFLKSLSDVFCHGLGLKELRKAISLKNLHLKPQNDRANTKF